MNFKTWKIIEKKASLEILLACGLLILVHMLFLPIYLYA